MTADSVPAAEAMVWTMLFSWTVWSPPEAQNRHRDDGCRDRRRKRQADLQTQVDVRGREQQRNNAAEDDAAEGQFFERRLLRRVWRRHEKSFRCLE